MTTKEIIILRLPYDKTSSFGKGSDKAPDKILSCLQEQIEIYERFTKTNPVKELKFSFPPQLKIQDLTPEQMFNQVKNFIKPLLKENKFIVSLGGEHSVSIPIFKAVSELKNPKEITILQIDAHYDLRKSDKDYNKENPTKFAHSTVMHHALNYKFNILPIGIRAYSEYEKNLIEKNKIISFEWPQKENKKLIKKIISSIKTKKVYLTIDVDGIDPSFMPATGTPVQGGLSWYFLIDLLKELFEKKEVISSDIVEVCPIPYSNLTEYGAAFLVYYIIALKFKKIIKK